MSKIIQQASLAYRDERSDKVYHMQLVQDGKEGRDGPFLSYAVNFQFGRRGSTLQTGTKIETDDLKDAEKVYNKVYGEKVGKGYKLITRRGPIDSSDSAMTSGPTESGRAGYVVQRKIAWEPAVELVVPQLLNMIEESEVEEYLKDDRFACQDKKDGRHQIIIKSAEASVRVLNKKGKEIGYPQAFADAVESIGQCVIDGEAIGDRFHAFDLLELEGKDLRGLGYGARYNLLISLSEKFGDAVVVVPLATGYKAKKALYNKLKTEKKEGIVFKKLDAKFKAGKGSDMLKFKFLADASCRVCEGRKGKRSVGIELMDENGKWIAVGNVTIGSPKIPLPSIGSVIDVSYLYYFKGGSLFQPIFKGVRDDVDESECVTSQLKYKAEEDMDE